jgi:hypothetical protein
LSNVPFSLFGFDGGVVKVSDGAHSKYSGRCLNLVYANFVKAVFASDGSRNSTIPVNKIYQCRNRGNTSINPRRHINRILFPVEYICCDIPANSSIYPHKGAGLSTT